MTAVLPVQGCQMPRVSAVPAAVSSAGVEAVELAATAGLVLDPWEQHVLDCALGEGPDGRWTSFEVGLVVPRQNGKGSILEARELAGLFLLDERLIIHSAHLFDTSMEAFRRLLGLIEDTPDLARRVKRVTKSHGEEGIELKSGQRIRFRTRTAGGGRGLSGDTVILDEAMLLTDKHVAALMPTMAARSQQGNPQLWYAASAGDEESLVLGRLRERGLAGGDPSLCYLEWSVDEAVYEADPDSVAADPAAWAQANPGMGIRISADHIAREQRSMNQVEFARERLSVTRWPDLSATGGWPIPEDVWTACEDKKSQIVGPLTFTVDVSPDRSRAAIGVSGLRSDGLRHVEVVDCRAGTGWVVMRFIALRDRQGCTEIVLDPAGPAGSLIGELEEAGFVVRTMTARDTAQAAGQLYDAAVEGKLRHIGQQWLSSALAGAKKRKLADSWTWDRKSGGDVCPLYAVTIAHWSGATAVDVSASVW